MFDVLLIVAVLMLTGTTLVVLVKRERVLQVWLNRELACMRDEIDRSCEPEAVASPDEEKALDSVETEDIEIAANLDRMNLLLDRLNGLLRGRVEPDQRRARRIVFHEEALPMGWMLDFTSPDELQRFGSLPPISDEEIQTMDWECLFDKLRADEMQQ